MEGGRGGGGDGPEVGEGARARGWVGGARARGWVGVGRTSRTKTPRSHQRKYVMTPPAVPESSELESSSSCASMSAIEPPMGPGEGER